MAGHDAGLTFRFGGHTALRIALSDWPLADQTGRSLPLLLQIKKGLSAPFVLFTAVRLALLISRLGPQITAVAGQSCTLDP